MILAVDDLSLWSWMNVGPKEDKRHDGKIDGVRGGAGIRDDGGAGRAGQLLSAPVGRLSARRVTGARRQSLVLRPAAWRARHIRSQDRQGRACVARLELGAAWRHYGARRL